jgi:hypothetical protein
MRAEDPTKLGGARVIVATAPTSAAIAGLILGLGRNGVLLAIAGAADPMPVSPAQLIGRRLAIQGWPSGSPKDSEDTLNSFALTGVRPMIEEFPLEDAARVSAHDYQSFAVPGCPGQPLRLPIRFAGGAAFYSSRNAVIGSIRVARSVGR